MISDVSFEKKKKEAFWLGLAVTQESQPRSMDASDARAMASRANGIRYEGICNIKYVFLWGDDEFDGDGKRVYLTRSKLQTKLKGVPLLRWEARKNDACFEGG